MGDSTGGATSGVTEDDMGDATRWLTYDDMATALGITTESVKRLAMRRKWPRRPGNDGRALVAVSDGRLDQAVHNAGESRDAKALIGFLERRIHELFEEVAEARMEARGARFEAESLRVQAGRIDVLAGLLETERAPVAEAQAEMVARVDAGRALLKAVQAERDRLLVAVTEHRRSCWDQVVGQRTGTRR